MATTSGRLLACPRTTSGTLRSSRTCTEVNSSKVALLRLPPPPPSLSSSMRREEGPDVLVDRRLLGRVQVAGVVEDLQPRRRHKLCRHVRVGSGDDAVQRAMDHERRRSDPLETPIAV